jgi:hypothetical protein
MANSNILTGFSESKKIAKMGEGTEIDLSKIPAGTEGIFAGTKVSSKSWGSYACYRTNIKKFDKVLVPSFKSPMADKMQFPEKIQFDGNGGITVI